jgi:hypothetical protein
MVPRRKGRFSGVERAALVGLIDDFAYRGPGPRAESDRTYVASGAYSSSPMTPSDVGISMPGFVRHAGRAKLRTAASWS